MVASLEPNSRRISKPSTSITQVIPLIVISISVGPAAVGSTISMAEYGMAAVNPQAQLSASILRLIDLTGIGSRPGKRTTSTELLTK